MSKEQNKLSVKDVASRYGLSNRQVQKHCDNGTINCHKDKNGWRFFYEDELPDKLDVRTGRKSSYKKEAFDINNPSDLVSEKEIVKITGLSFYRFRIYKKARTVFEYVEMDYGTKVSGKSVVAFIKSPERKWKFSAYESQQAQKAKKPFHEKVFSNYDNLMKYLDAHARKQSSMAKPDYQSTFKLIE